jgi:hypothetical protein
LSHSSTPTGSFSGPRGMPRGVPTVWGAHRLRGASMPAMGFVSLASPALRRQQFWTFITPQMSVYLVCGPSELIRMILLKHQLLVCLLLIYRARFFIIINGTVQGPSQ